MGKCICERGWDCDASAEHTKGGERCQNEAIDGSWGCSPCIEAAFAASNARQRQWDEAKCRQIIDAAKGVR
ncbi:MAG: hypothetical protein M3P06_11535 [Acidobacteriota bacterium]|nr:hypothetical protein [Acidobacteriota bacterium]